MSITSFKDLEGLFILGFGVFHFLVPFIAPVNKASNIIFLGIQMADLVVPGSIILALLSIVFYYFKDMYSMATLAFMYLCGTVFHALFLIGLTPSIIVVPHGSALVFGAFIDTFTPIIILDYSRRHARSI